MGKQKGESSKGSPKGESSKGSSKKGKEAAQRASSTRKQRAQWLDARELASSCRQEIKRLRQHLAGFEEDERKRIQECVRLEGVIGFLEEVKLEADENGHERALERGKTFDQERVSEQRAEAQWEIEEVRISMWYYETAAQGSANVANSLKEEISRLEQMLQSLVDFTVQA